MQRTLIPLISLFVICGACVESGLADDGPSFELDDLNGVERSLSDYRGDVVVLNFWATWCFPCRAEFPHLNEFHARYEDRGVAVLGVSVSGSTENESSKIRDFVRKHGLEYPILLGDTEVQRAFEVMAIPHTAIIGPSGNIRERFTGVVTFNGLQNVVEPLLDEGPPPLKPRSRQPEHPPRDDKATDDADWISIQSGDKSTEVSQDARE